MAKRSKSTRNTRTIIIRIPIRSLQINIIITAMPFLIQFLHHDLPHIIRHHLQKGETRMTFCGVANHKQIHRHPLRLPLRRRRHRLPLPRANQKSTNQTKSTRVTKKGTRTFLHTSRECTKSQRTTTSVPPLGLRLQPNNPQLLRALCHCPQLHQRLHQQSY